MVKRVERVLVIVAHPDDAESWAGGTIAKLVQNGAQVAYCVVTNGDKGSGDRSMTPERLAATRQAEQRDAARVLGVETVDFLGFPDCEVENTRQTRMAVTAAIRRHRPDLLLTQDPNRTKLLGASHRDHRVVGEIALDCIYPLARAHLAFPELLNQGLEPTHGQRSPLDGLGGSFGPRRRHLRDHRGQDRRVGLLREPDARLRGARQERPRTGRSTRQTCGLRYAEVFARMVIDGSGRGFP
jgi:LmbE family N-acetylglucosaminyl deacetylase